MVWMSPGSCHVQEWPCSQFWCPYDQEYELNTVQSIEYWCQCEMMMSIWYQWCDCDCCCVDWWPWGCGWQQCCCLTGCLTPATGGVETITWWRQGPGLVTAVQPATAMAPGMEHSTPGTLHHQILQEQGGCVCKEVVKWFRGCATVASVLAGGLSTAPITAKALSLCTFDGESPHLQEGSAMFYVDEVLLPVLCVCCFKISQCAEIFQERSERWIQILWRGMNVPAQSCLNSGPQNNTTF